MLLLLINTYLSVFNKTLHSVDAFIQTDLQFEENKPFSGEINHSIWKDKYVCVYFISLTFVLHLLLFQQLSTKQITIKTQNTKR